MRCYRFGLTVLDTLTVNSSYEGWLVFNVSEAMTTWLQDNNTNHGIYIEAHSTNGKPRICYIDILQFIKKPFCLKYSKKSL